MDDVTQDEVKKSGTYRSNSGKKNANRMTKTLQFLKSIPANPRRKAPAHWIAKKLKYSATSQTRRVDIVSKHLKPHTLKCFIRVNVERALPFGLQPIAL